MSRPRVAPYLTVSPAAALAFFDFHIDDNCVAWTKIGDCLASRELGGLFSLKLFNDMHQIAFAVSS